MHGHPRRTKIVATLGPATDAPGVLDALLRAGVDVVRLNFSHGDPASQLARAQAVREAGQRVGVEVGILADLPGPKIRIERFAAGRVELREPREASHAEIERFHKHEHVERVRVLSMEGYGSIDYGDTPAYPGVYEASANVVGSALRGLEQVMGG